MDIRNFFGKKKKSSPAAGAKLPAPKPPAPSKRAKAKANAPARTSASSRGNDAGKKKKKAADDGGSDTEMEDDEVGAAPSISNARGRKKASALAGSDSETEMEDDDVVPAKKVNRRGNDAKKKEKKRAAAADDSDGDTETEGEEAVVSAAKINNRRGRKKASDDGGDGETETEDDDAVPAKKKNNRGGMKTSSYFGGDAEKKRAESSGSDTEMEGGEIPIQRGKKADKEVALAASDSETEMEDNAAPAKRINDRGRKKAVKNDDDSDATADEGAPGKKAGNYSDSETEMEEDAPKTTNDRGKKKAGKYDSPPAKRAKKERVKIKPHPPSDDGEEEEEEEKSPEPLRRSPRKKRRQPLVPERKAKRKIVIESDSEEDIIDIRPAPRKKVTKVDLMEDSDDGDDFKPASDDDDGSDDDLVHNDDSDDDFVQRPKKGRAASPKKRSVSPKRRAASSKRRAASPKRTPPPKRAASPERKAAAKRPEPLASSGPPKYHPPSTQLVTHIPFLENNSGVDLPPAPPLPKLPEDNPNFDIDDLTPRCLEGLTFVFTGVLSTNDAATVRTNAEVSRTSPNRGDYYANRRIDCSDTNCELSRDTATDIVKSLGGRVTTGVSGRTDYLIVGSILEDGRPAEEGSKYKKCIELWEAWGRKWRKEYADDGGGDEDAKKRGKGGKKGTAKPKKDRDPNTLVEIVQGIYEFYGLVVFLSEWKKGTLPESERSELEARRKPKKEVEAKPTKAAGTPSASSSASKPTNPYASASAGKKSPTNPYAKRSTPPNPYAKKSAPANPYAKSSSVSNPYASGNPYAKKSPSSSLSAPPRPVETEYHPDGKELGANSLWADRYAPSHSRDILGNSDGVNKLRRWLSNWESTFNDPKRGGKALTNPNGPFKAALLSGPPGIGKTTTATLVARESGRDVLELNASDARGKKALTQALGDVTGSRVLTFDNMGKSKKKRAPIQKRCIIMDEVDGMGAGDRSGMSELIQMIRKSKVPIICICNDRMAQKMKSLVQYCMDLRYRRPTKGVIARRAVEIGRKEGINVEPNAAEAMAESCGNDIRQVLNSLQMWSCKKKATGDGGDSGGGASMTYRDLKERQGEINKDEVLRVSMFDACRSIVEGSRGLAGADPKAVTASLFKRTDAFFVDYMMMGLMVHQNYLKVSMGQYNNAKLNEDEDAELEALNHIHEATHAMSDFGMCEESLRGGDQNWALLPLCSVLAVKVGHHAGGPNGGFLPGYPEFAGWLGKNSTRNKKIRMLQELRRHMNYKVSADAPELRMNYLPIMRQQFQELLFDGKGARVTEAIELMDEYGLDRDDIFENFDEFLLNSKELRTKKFGDLDGKSKAAFTRAYNSTAHRAQALVAEQGAEKTGGRKKGGGGGGGEMAGAELDVVDDDKAAAEDSDEEENEEDLEALKKKFLKKGRGKGAAAGKAKAASKTNNGKKGKKK